MTCHASRCLMENPPVTDLADPPLHAEIIMSSSMTESFILGTSVSKAIPRQG